MHDAVPNILMSMAGLLVLRWPSTCKDTFKGSGASVVRPASTWISGHWRALVEMHWREFDGNFLSKPAEAVSSLVYPLPIPGISILLSAKVYTGDSLEVG